MMTHLVLVVCMQIQTALSGLLPTGRDGVVDVGLMDDLWDQTRLALDQARIRHRQLCPVDRIFRSVFHQQSQQRGHAAHQEGQDQDVDEQEEEKSSAHPRRRFPTARSVISSENNGKHGEGAILRSSVGVRGTIARVMLSRP